MWVQPASHRLCLDHLGSKASEFAQKSWKNVFSRKLGSQKEAHVLPGHRHKASCHCSLLSNTCRVVHGLQSNLLREPRAGIEGCVEGDGVGLNAPPEKTKCSKRAATRATSTWLNNWIRDDLHVEAASQSSALPKAARSFASQQLPHNHLKLMKVTICIIQLFG